MPCGYLLVNWSCTYRVWLRFFVLLLNVSRQLLVNKIYIPFYAITIIL